MSKLWLLMSYATRDASRSRVVLALVVASLGLAFAVVLACTSVLNGFEQTLDQGARNDSGDLIVMPEGTSTTIDNVDAVTAKLDSLNNVASWSVRTYAIGNLHYKNFYSNPFAIRGVDPAKEDKTVGLSTFLLSGDTGGSYLNTDHPHGVLIGHDLAEFLVGKPYGNEFPPIGATIELNVLGATSTAKLTIAGVFDSKNFLSNEMLYLTKPELERISPLLKDHDIAVKLKDQSKLNETKKAIEDANLDVTVKSWRDNAGYIGDILNLVDFITSTINALLIVAIFIIICAILFISVFQKRRQIGIMKSMGAGNAFIIGVFMFETLVYSFFAYLIGFGLFLGIYYYSISHPLATLIGNFTLVFDLQRVVITSVILFIASMMGSFIPAYIAAKTQIIRVLRDTT